MLDAYDVATYCCYYMTNIEKTIALTFKHIFDDHRNIDEDVTQMIGRLGNALLNLQTYVYATRYLHCSLISIE